MSKSRLSRLLQSSVQASTEARPVEEPIVAAEPVVEETPVDTGVVGDPAAAAPAEVTPVVDEVPTVTVEDAEPAREPSAEEPVAEPVAEEPAAVEPPAAEEPVAPAVEEPAAVEPPAADPVEPVAEEPIAAVEPVEPAPPAPVEEVVAEPVVEEPVVPAEEPAAEPVAEPTAVEPAPAGSDDAGMAIEVNDPETVEADLVEAKDAEADVNELDAAHDRMHEIAEGLESFVAYAAESLKQGGLSPQSAAVFSMGVESLTKPLGLESAPVLSVESFGGQKTRLDATRLSMEGVQDVIKQLWEAIKATAAKLWEAIKAFFDKVFDAAAKLQTRAQALEEKAKAASGSPKEAQIDVGNGAKFAINNQVVQPAQGMSILEKVATDFISYDNKLVDEAVQAAQTINGVISANDESMGPALEKLAAIKPMIGGAYSANHKDEGDGKQSASTPVLPGGKTFSLTVGPSFFFEAHEESAEQNVTEGAKIGTLSLADIAKVAADAATVASMAIGFKEEGKLFKAELLADQVSPSAELSEENAKKAQDALRSFAKSSAELRKTSARLLGYLVQTSAGYLALAEKSLAQYGGEAKAAAPVEDKSKEAAAA